MFIRSAHREMQWLQQGRVEREQSRREAEGYLQTAREQLSEARIKLFDLDRVPAREVEGLKKSRRPAIS